ncbi:MAG: DUF423 domain-containing protein [Chitinophagaceae bacterium]|nr:DUF423 domain-containing protein [Chitinophagaceae bacterium]
MNVKFLKIAFVLGALGVALGAFGAHALKEQLEAQQLQTYQTAVQYQLYHVFALAVAGLLQFSFPSKWLTNAGYLFVAGIILFSGSLYAMSFLKAAGIKGVSWLGAITPLGGVAFIAGWLCLFMTVKKIRR